MQTSEIAKRWLQYFEKNDHVIRPSVPLVSPDPSILFTIAGMVPFIPYIIGTEKAPWPRAASVQKCIRTNDIENVGRTTRHGTFFQMNGNFSFGDYFKEGAIDFAWELLTGRVEDGLYGLDGDRMWVTIWDQDDVSYDHLTKHIGMDPKHIVQLPREDIFWHTGQPGPAGPCAEFHYDRGPAYGPEAVGGTVDPGGDRYLEVWNLVFDQYLRGEGTGSDFPLLGELDEKAIDTGAGLERLAFVLQDKPNMFEIDQVRPVITATEEMSGHKYDAGGNPEHDVHMRIVADHVRSAMMLINDGVIPGNDGRGYVLRRIMRRAIRSMRLLGVDEATMPTLMPVSRDVMKSSYPELETNWSRIADVAYSEEESFRRTLSSGTTILDTAVDKAKKGASKLSGEDAFRLHDTYGFPIDLTLEMAREQGVDVDEVRFHELMEEQKTRARADALAKKSGHVDSRIYHDIQHNLGGNSRFVGYTDSKIESKIAGIVVDGNGVPAASAPADVEIVLDTTPFYAEKGGQLADHGTIRTASGALIDVHDVQEPVKGLAVHRGRLLEGTVALDELAIAEIDAARRLAIARAHTATHMVHKGLHEFLGEQATQAGSENSPSRMRFDFHHPSQVPSDVMDGIEERVNQRLAEDLTVTDTIMSLDEARGLGAMALFGEKYGNEVRVVDIGDGWSLELCAGTHVPSTGHIGRIAVLGESSIGSGVRRIDALVGDGAYGFQAKEHAIVSQLSAMMGANVDELPGRIESLMKRLKEAEKTAAKLGEQQLLARAGEIAARVHERGSVQAVVEDLGELPSTDALRSLVTDIRARLGESKPAVVAGIGVVNGRPQVVVATNDSARTLGVKAGNLVRIGAKALKGGGGGRDDLAQGGGQDPEATGLAKEAIESELR
ncbi:alanine--tRNA ligase [Actinomyces sp. S4-C9]|uniref:alanine--tRNA ligase n=1 Tax=Actinomyces sp. S4-C9 TaxID=1219581 RepID=UPI00050F2BF9|nr:alanine--tRNA ligase [Actinomyces sp. S4-C9]KGF02013.1 alanyl-tRNA synthetase [Actinomyces sp. S4-C9]